MLFGNIISKLLFGKRLPVLHVFCFYK